MAHTFLLRPGRWSAHGRFFDARYRLQALRGELEVRHEALNWLVTGWMELADSKKRLELSCPIAPSKGGASANWSCDHPGIGHLDGSLSLAGRRMFSSFHSQDDRHAGQATFTRKDEHSYLAEGEFRREAAIVCSWEIILRLPRH